MEVNAKFSLKRVPARCPQGPGDDPQVNADKSSQSFWYYRRTAKRRIYLSRQSTLDQIGGQCGDDLRQTYQNRVNAIEALPEVTKNTVGGHYIPHAQVCMPGVIPETDEHPEINHRSALFELAPSYDCTASEQPTHNQQVPVCTALVSVLQQHAMFKPRDNTLLQSLRSKAQQEVRKYSTNTETWKTHQIAMSVALAFEPGDAEMLALTHIKSPAVASKWNWVNDVLGGGNKDLVDCLQTKPKLVTRFLNMIYSSPDKLTPLTVKTQPSGPR